MKIHDNLARSCRRPVGQPRALGWFWWPLRLFVLYIAGTFFLYLLGPTVYPEDQNALGAACFMTAALIFFAIGYRAGRAVPLLTVPSRSLLHFMRYAFMAGLIAACCFGALMFVEGLHAGISRDSIMNPGALYQETMTAAREATSGDTSRVGQLAVLVAPLSWLAIPIGLVSLRSLSRSLKAVVLASFCLPVLNALLALGTFKRTGDATIVVASVVVLLAYRREIRMQTLKWCLVAGTVAFLSYFAFHQYSRLEAYNATGVSTIGEMRLNRENVVFKLLGQEIGTGTAAALSYLCQGYYPLGLCLRLPFEWTGGLGHSFAAMSYAGQYFGMKDVIFHTYPLRLEAAEGHSGLQVWHTIFPWLASDLTFTGCLFFMGLLGWFYARVWLEATIYANPLSIAAFCYLNTMLIFIPCNNQLFQQRESAVAMYGIIVLWVCFHKHLNNPFALDFITGIRSRMQLKQDYLILRTNGFAAGPGPESFYPKSPPDFPGTSGGIRRAI